MSVSLNTQTALYNFVHAVKGKTRGHAHGVEKIFPSLVGYVMVYRDQDSEFQSWTPTGNTTWATFAGKRIAFRYARDPQRIEARRGTLQGDVLFSFDNSTSLTAMHRFFESLKPTTPYNH